MEVELVGIGKRFERHYIFRNISETFSNGDRIAVLGGNGSGKSTLLKVISGSLTLTEGQLIVRDKSEIPISKYMRMVAFAGPYTELIEEFNLHELVQFQSRFRGWINGMSDSNVVSATRLEDFAHRPISTFSSGMRQRVRLALAILSDSPVLLLDEPTSNLDEKGIKWFETLLSEHVQDRILFVGSNHQSREIALCTKEVNLRK